MARVAPAAAVLAGVGAPAGPGTVAVSAPASGQADSAQASEPIAARPARAGVPASGNGRGVLAPWVATSCRIAMGITMGFMLVIMI